MAGPDNGHYTAISLSGRGGTEHHLPSKKERGRALAKSEWRFKTAVECSAALQAKKISAVELAQDAIGRIERHDAKINAVCVRDFDRGLEAARAADAALARGETKPLLGLPMTVKESYNIAGLPTTWGFSPPKDFRPAGGAPPITRGKEASGGILPKTKGAGALRGRAEDQ